MELFGLHDKDGKEWKLVKEDTQAYASWKAQPVTPKPKFKIGDWVVYIDHRGVGISNTPLRIDDIRPNNIAVFQLNNQAYYEDFKNLRFATKDEIESHLREIAEEKYHDCICKDMASVFNVKIGDILSSGYSEISDKYYVNDFCVYSQGKWAEIVPSKKKLPSSKKELIGLLISWDDRKTDFRYADFLKDYED